MTAAGWRGYCPRTMTVLVNVDVPIQSVAVTTAVYVPGLSRTPAAVRPFQVQP